MPQPSKFPPHPGQLLRLSPHQTNRNRGRGVKGGAHRWAGVPKDQPVLSSSSALCPFRGRAPSVIGEHTESANQ